MRELLDAARFAPSGSNIQPWRVHVLAGAPLRALTDEVSALVAAGTPDDTPQYTYYANPLPELYLARRRAHPPSAPSSAGTVVDTLTRAKIRRVRIAKPILLVSTPLGVVLGLVEAARFHWWLAALMAVLLSTIGAFAVMTARRIRRDAQARPLIGRRADTHLGKR